MAKVAIEIERLLQWAYREELPKRHTSSAEGIWDRIRSTGELGGVDMPRGHGGAQRYADFGLPDPDAEEIERAVGALPDGVIDWATESGAIMGGLLAIADTRPLTARPRPQRETSVTYRARSQDNIGWRTERLAPPRDVIMVRTLKTSALVTMHARNGTRPEWYEAAPRPHRVEPDKGPKDRPKIVGECRGHNHYSTGSYCPLRWDPSPMTIAASRGDYVAWWRGLALLAESLELQSFTALPPDAPEYPWRDGEPQRQTFEIGAQSHARLPLRPVRDRAGAPPPRPRHGPVRHVK